MSKDKFEDFKQGWEGQIAKIENQAIDGEGVSHVRLRFELDQSSLIMSMTEVELAQVDSELRMLQSKLEIALQIAHSRFKLKNRGVLARAFAGILDKLPTRKSSKYE